MPEEPQQNARVLRTDCCIAGGGPAGMMLGYLLARAGVDVVVMEKHRDFLRDFRGDTIHPSTLDLMHELGLLEEFLRLPHDELPLVRGRFGGVEVTLADFSHLPTHCHFIALMPQWDFLNFLADHARRFPHFHLEMEANATDLIEEQGQCVGMRASTPNGPLEVRATLTVGADGRHSTVRAKAGLQVDDLGSPIDVLWMRLSRRPTDPPALLGRFEKGKMMITISRGDYWQCGYVIGKGVFDEIKRRGLPAFQAELAQIAPFLADRVGELADWSQISLLTVRVDRLRRWYQPGLLCIGDAAHAMSPVGGVGINLAIQDAVATANLLYRPLKQGSVTSADLDQLQQRREFPARITQKMQIFLQNRFLNNVLRNQRSKAPLVLRLIIKLPLFSRLPARFVGMGVRPEHVQTPNTPA